MYCVINIPTVTPHFHQDVQEDIEGAKIFYVGDENGDTFYYIKDLYRTDKF